MTIPRARINMKRNHGFFNRGTPQLHSPRESLG
jgi:hypothetical protein